MDKALSGRSASIAPARPTKGLLRELRTEAFAGEIVSALRRQSPGSSHRPNGPAEQSPGLRPQADALAWGLPARWAGHLEFCLRWLEKHDSQPHEEPPIGLILCAGKKRETVELLELEKSGIRLASYWLEQIPRKLLEEKLHDAIRLARGLIDAKETTRE